MIAFTDKSGAPTGAEALTSEYATIESLARTLMNDAGQTVAARQYFNLDGLSYSTDRELGVEGVNYLESRSTFDPRGRLAITSDPAGAIRHTFFDAAGRAVQTWIGSDDVPAVDYNGDGVIDPRDFRWYAAQYGAAPANTNMVLVSMSIYDGGLSMGDGLLTESRAYFGSGANDYYATYHQYDWRGRMAGTLGPDGVATIPVLDNLGRAATTRVYASATYDAQYLQIEVTAADLRAKSETYYDNRGQVYETRIYEVDQSDGTISGSLSGDNWYDAAGRLIKSQAIGSDTFTKYEYLCMCQLGGGDFSGFVGVFSLRGIGWSSFSQMSMAA